jgi:hypothetical protein
MGIDNSHTQGWNLRVHHGLFCTMCHHVSRHAGTEGFLMIEKYHVV